LTKESNVRRVAVVAVGLATILSASACSAPTNPVTAAAPSSPLPAANVHATQVLRLRTVGQLGEIVVDINGYTLYRFDKDTAKPPHSNCLDDCFPKWPPLMDTGDLRSDGVDPALIGSVVRSDSTRQVTIANWPVYRFSGDTAPGDARGQGLGKVWFAITATGKKAAGPPAGLGANAGAGSTPGGSGSGGGPTPSPSKSLDTNF
jgi:predicted lipoprotein with Yx(FWY)xxD motif